MRSLILVAGAALATAGLCSISIDGDGDNGENLAGGGGTTSEDVGSGAPAASDSLEPAESENLDDAGDENGEDGDSAGDGA